MVMAECVRRPWDGEVRCVSCGWHRPRALPLSPSDILEMSYDGGKRSHQKYYNFFFIYTMLSVMVERFCRSIRSSPGYLVGFCNSSVAVLKRSSASQPRSLTKRLHHANKDAILLIAVGLGVVIACIIPCSVDAIAIGLLRRDTVPWRN